MTVSPTKLESVREDGRGRGSVREGEREGARDKATKKKREQGPAIHACCLLEALVPYTRHTKLVCMHKLSGSGLTATMGAQKSSHNRSWSEDGRNRVLTTA